MLLLKNACFWQWDPDTLPFSGRLAEGWCLIDDVRGVFDTVFCEDSLCIDDQRSAYEQAQAQATRVIDMKCNEGNILLPGLIDSHIHVGYMGEACEYLQLRGTRSLDDLSTAVRNYGKENPKKSWIIGVGWDQSGWGGCYPTRQVLDEAMREDKRPLVLYRECWHIVVANTAALQRAGIRLTPTNEHFSGVDLDASGVPTGIFRETAVLLITNHIAENNEKLREVYIRNALNNCLRAGLTAVQTNDIKAWNIYQNLEAKGELPLRVFLTINYEEFEEEGKQPNFHTLNSKPPLFTCRRIKLYSDGSLGAETAALRSPYPGSTNRGLLIHNVEDLAAKICHSHEAGFQLEVHAIGDRALSTVLEALKRARIKPGARPVITHCQVLGEDLINRMAKQGVVASIQPSFVGTDCQWIQERLPSHVLKTSYCWKSLLENGVYCAGGSDSPVEGCEPLSGIYDAMHRLSHASKLTARKKKDTTSTTSGVDESSFLPRECLTFTEALHLYTIGGAYACHMEKHLGRIAPGYQADLVVVDRDVTGPRGEDTCHALLEAAIKEVWVGGICRFDKMEEEGPRRKGTERDLKLRENLKGPYIPGKNGPTGHQKPVGSLILGGKRLGIGCCGR